MPPLPPEVYAPVMSVLALSLATVFGFLLKAKDKHIRSERDHADAILALSREQADAAKEIATALESLEGVIRERRR